MAEPLRCGLLGAGVVGGGVVQLLASDPRVKFVRLCVRDATKARDFAVPEGCAIVTDPEALLQDDIDCLVEVAGGTGLAYDLMQRAMKAGKSVVTANKAAISLHLDALNESATGTGKPFLFEAAVCGGIPIINTLRSGLVGDKMSRLAGIMNGTTNYILSRMQAEGLGYEAVLGDAQRLGYAEADPAADVEGWDARSKLCILSKMCYGLTLDEQGMFCQGLTRISANDFEYAKMMGKAIKFLGVSSVQGSTVNAWLSPVLVDLGSPVAVTTGPTNLIEVTSANLGVSTYIGAGAGRMPTANSVVADILRVRAPVTAAFGAPPYGPLQFERDFESAFYVRVVLKDGVGALHALTGSLAECGVSIFSVLQTPIVDRARVPCAIVTDSCKLSQMETFIEKMTSSPAQCLLEDP